MKILHTSDWHLGSSLHDRKRYEESRRFFDWLIEIIIREKIDVLLVAGDIFDTSTPSNRAQELYYLFLNRVAKIPGLQVVVTSGNHDSPSLLNAPKALLRQLRIQVIGSIPEDITDEVLVLHDNDGFPSLIVCAVPFLRDKDVRTAEPGEGIDEKSRNLRNGIEEHYRQVFELANLIRLKLGKDIPIVAMGHLLLQDSLSYDDDGVRDLHFGNLVGISPNTIDFGFDYIALGHLHSPSDKDENSSIQYCGSPLPMNFRRDGQEKKVIIIDFSRDRERNIRSVRIPCFRELREVTGSAMEVEAEIQNLCRDKGLCRDGLKVWVEVKINSVFGTASVLNRIQELVRNSIVEVLMIEDRSLTDQALREMEKGENLPDLDEGEVFTRCLAAHDIHEDDQADLRHLFHEILIEIQQEDPNAI